MALGDLFRPPQCSEFINLIIPKDTVRFIGMLASVNRELNSSIMNSSYGRCIWLELVTTITGHDATKFINTTTTPTNQLFFNRVKLMLCPWLSPPQILPFELPSIVGNNPRMDIAITSRNRLALRINDGEDDGDDAEEFDDVYSMPCRPCEPSLFNILCTGLPSNYPLPRPLLGGGTNRYTTYPPHPPSRISLSHPMFRVVSIFVDFSNPCVLFRDPVQDAQLLTDPLAMDYFEVGICHSKSTQQYRVHAGVFAVVEFHNTTGEEDGGDLDAFNGIYFFTSSTPQRMLRHMQPAPFQFETETDMCFLPMEMWLLADHCIWYFGPHRLNTEKEKLANPSEKLAPALWLAFNGHCAKALEYLIDRSIGINTPSLVLNKKTVLHHAAMGGDVHTIQALIAAGADVDAQDSLGETPLCNAVRWLHADAIRELLRAGAQVASSESLFRLIGKITDDERLTDEKDMCDTIDALLDNIDRTYAHLMFFSDQVLHYPRAIQKLIQRGIPTNMRMNGRYALHVYMQTVPWSPEVTATISLFNDEDFATEFNGLTPLRIATDREFHPTVLEHIKCRIEKARHAGRE